MHHLMQFRQKMRTRKLTDALVTYARQILARKKDDRLIKKDMAQLDLVAQMDTESVERNRLKHDKFNILKKAGSHFSKTMLNQQQMKLNQFNAFIKDSFIPVVNELVDQEDSEYQNSESAANQ